MLAVLGTCTGEAWARFGRVVYRAKEPKQFWRLIAIYYLGVSLSSDISCTGYTDLQTGEVTENPVFSNCAFHRIRRVGKQEER